MQGSIPAGERRVLFTQRVGQAWEELSQNMDMIRRSFKKSGIALLIDGSSDATIHLEGVLGYTVGGGEDDEEEDEDELEVESEDPFVDC